MVKEDLIKSVYNIISEKIKNDRVNAAIECQWIFDFLDINIGDIKFLYFSSSSIISIGCQVTCSLRLHKRTNYQNRKTYLKTSLFHMLEICSPETLEKIAYRLV